MPLLADSIFRRSLGLAQVLEPAGKTPCSQRHRPRWPSHHPRRRGSAAMVGLSARCLGLTMIDGRVSAGLGPSNPRTLRCSRANAVSVRFACARLLHAFRQRGDLRSAAEVAKVSTWTIWNWRRSEEQFARAFEEAEDLALMEQRRRRADERSRTPTGRSSSCSAACDQAGTAKRARCLRGPDRRSECARDRVGDARGLGRDEWLLPPVVEEDRLGPSVQLPADAP